MRGQEEWEGRRSERAGGVRGHEERKAVITELAKLRELTHAAPILCHVGLKTKPGNKRLG